MLRWLYLLVTRPSVLKCLVRQVDPDRMDEAFEQEYREQFSEPSDGSGLDEFWLEKTWNPFIKQLEPNDELWFYRMPDEYWVEMMGHAGYVILRNGKVIAQIVTFIN